MTHNETVLTAMGMTNKISKQMDILKDKANNEVITVTNNNDTQGSQSDNRESTEAESAESDNTSTDDTTKQDQRVF
jgi:hypothetical protein